MTDRIPDEELLDAIRELGEELGRRPTYREMNDQGRYWASTVDQRFGWNRGLELAGFDTGDRPNAGRDVSAESVYADIRCVAEELGRTPTRSEYDEHGDYPSHLQVINDHLSWWHVVCEAGLDPNNGTLRAPNGPHLIEHLQEVAVLLDRTPTPEQFEELSPYSVKLYESQFVTFNYAIEVAGVENDLAHLEFEDEVEDEVENEVDA